MPKKPCLLKKGGRPGFMETSVHGWMLRMQKTLPKQMAPLHPPEKLSKNGMIYPEIITTPWLRLEHLIGIPL